MVTRAPEFNFRTVYGLPALICKERTRVLFGLLVVIGVSLRIVNLGGLEFYHDEAAALTLTTGHRPTEFTELQEAAGAPFAADVLSYQKLDPSLGIMDCVIMLAKSDPLHPPLYYILSRLWIGAFGDTPAAVRALSAVIGIGCLVGIWFLALSLFGSRQTAMLAVLLSAVSPFQFLVFANAREYGLWLLLCVLSTRQLIERKWYSYFVLTLLSLYTSFLSVFVIVAHALFLRVPGLRIRRGALWTAVLFGPWLLLVIRYWSGLEKMKWMSEPVPLRQYLSSLAASLFKIFFDLNLRLDTWTLENALAGVAIAAILALEAAAFYSLWRRRGDQRTVILVMLLIGLTLLPTVGFDLLLGGHRGMSARYHVFGFLIVQLTVVQFLSRLLKEPGRRRLGTAILSVLLGLGLLSELRISQSSTWWNKTFGSDAGDIARQIQDPAHALILSTDLYHLIAISRYVEPRTRLLAARNWPRLSRGYSYSHIYFLRGTDAELADFARQNHAVFHPLTPGLMEVELMAGDSDG